MSTTLNRPAYQQLVDEDVAWLEKQPRTLERDHVILIVKKSVGWLYDPYPGLRVVDPPERSPSVGEDPVTERERCARHCEVLAHFLENGAGPLNAPSARLRQAAANIRSGKPASLWLASYREDPDFSVPVPKCGHGAQSWIIACETCGASETGGEER